MSFFIRSLLIISLMIHPTISYSQNNEAKNFINEFHNDIEHGEESLLQEWFSNFNLMRIALDTHRSVQMKYYQDNGKSEYIRNFPVLASLYMLSHTVEMVSGPVGVYAASELGMGSAAQMIIGSVGAIITVPGLDPLCILLFAVSPLKPMQKMMTGIRVVAVKVSGGISSRLQLQKYMQKFFQSHDRLGQIAKNSELVLNSGEIPYLKLTFKKDASKNWVESLEVLDPKLLRENQSAVGKILKQFNFSVRYALQSALKKSKKTFYMESIETVNDQTKIQFKDYALLIKPALRFKRESQTETLICKSLFQ